MSAVARFTAAGVAGVGIVFGSILLLGMPLPAAGVAAGAVALALVPTVRGFRRHHSHAPMGAANLVTMFRLVMVGVLVGYLVAALADPSTLTPAASGGIIAISVVALTLDGVDGYLARRQGLASQFGAAFDVEVDSAFALVLSILAAFGPAGPAAILLGIPRYLFVAAAVALPWLKGPLPPRFSRKAVCVVQLIALIVLQVPILPTVPAVLVLVGALALVVWSFLRDVIVLARSRTRAT